MPGKQISLNLANGDGNVLLDEDQIVYIASDTLGAAVIYEDGKAGLRRSFTITDAPANVASFSDNLVSIALDNNEGTLYVNLDRILEMYDDDGKAVLFIDAAKASPEKRKSSASVSTVAAAIATKKGDTTYSFDSVNATNNSISIVAGAGDVSGNFTNGDAVSITGTSDASFDGVYTVSSASHSGVTTVVLNQDIPAGSGTSGLIMLA